MKFDRGLVAVVLICTLVFTTLNFSQDTLFDDGYFHIRFAEQMRTSIGILPHSLPNIYYSVWNYNFYDKHYLFHLFLMPFTFGDLFFGAKLANVLLAVLLFACFYFLMKKLNVNNPAVATIFLALCSSWLIFRLVLPRAISLGILLLVLGIYFIESRKPRALGILAFAFVWAYAAYPILLVVLIVLKVTEYMLFRTNYLDNLRSNRKLISYCVLGTILGIIINPFFPSNIINAANVDLEASLFRSPELGNAEWSSASTIGFISGSALVLGLVFFIVMFFLYKGKSMRETPFKYLVLSLFLAILSAKATRIIDFFIPVLVIFCFTAISQLGYKISADRRDIRQLIVVAIVSMIVAVPCLILLNDYITSDYGNFSPCTKWISENVPEKSIIYDTVYDDFPQLYFYLPNHYFISGMDEYYLYKYDKNMFRLQRDFWDGNVSGEKIKTQFNSSIVFLDKSQSKNTYDKLKKRNDYVLELDAKDCAVFRIK